MENCCSCYHTEPKIEYRYDTRGNCVTYEHTVGKCWGTKECEECFCKGDRTKCDFYSDIRAKAQKEEMENSLNDELTKAIELLTNNGYKVSKGEAQSEYGKWLCINGTIFCSECQGKALYKYNENDNDDFPFLLPMKSKRCPHCGARMEEEK